MKMGAFEESEHISADEPRTPEERKRVREMFGSTIRGLEDTVSWCRREKARWPSGSLEAEHFENLGAALEREIAFWRSEMLKLRD
ncbi:MAG: hypothetical protein JST16_15280 [Bdellovibrionales bacterium]|nr:hypothetical protein [Bdellovibrionales bacterium]